MASLIRNANTSPRITAPVSDEASRAGDQDLSNFNLRDTLGGITVRETSFAEFLSALRQAGYRPA